MLDALLTSATNRSATRGTPQLSAAEVARANCQVDRLLCEWSRKPYSSRTKHYSAASYLPFVSERTGYVRCYPAEASTGIHDDCNRRTRCHVKFHGISSCPHLWTAAVFWRTGATWGTYFAFLCADQPNLHASGVLGLRWSIRQCSILGDQVSV